MEVALKAAAKRPQATTKPPTHRKPRRAFSQDNAVADLLRASSSIQTKLKIGRPDDAFEQEADRVAECVVNRNETPNNETKSIKNQNAEVNPSISAPAVGPVSSSQSQYQSQTLTQPLTPLSSENPIQRACKQCEEELQRKEDDSDQHDLYGTYLDERHFSWVLSGASNGQPLDNRDFYETRFGHSFTDVRIHTGAQAESLATQLGARAFTHGRNIYFARGEYQPASRAGKTLIAHELTHTLQQRGGMSLIQRACGDAGCTSVDPDTPACPDAETFLRNATLEAIRQSVFDGPGNLRFLERGDSGTAVALLQALLLNVHCSGFDRAGLRAELASQTFGRHTDDAVEQFQRSHNDANGEPLAVDGDVGPATLSAMDIIMGLAPVNPAVGPEGVGQCYGTAEDGPGEARLVPAAEVIPVSPFFPAFKSWELLNFDIDESFVKTEHRRFIRDQVLPAVRDAEADFPDASDRHIRLVGEASTTAGNAYNLALSARRTHCVRETLIDEGIRAEDIRDHSASALGEELAQLRRAAAGLPVDNVEDRRARKVTIILDLTTGPDDDNDDCGDEDKTLASTDYRAKVACAGPLAMRVNIGNFGNPSQPVYREFIWQPSLPTFDGCFFRLGHSAEEFIRVTTPSDMQLAVSAPSEPSAHSDFQGVVSLLSDSMGTALHKEGISAVPAYLIDLRGDWSEAGCLPGHDEVPGVMRPMGPVRCGVVPAPPEADNCYPSDTEDECPDEVRQAAAQEFVATMVRISGDPMEALKQIRRIARYVAIVEWILDFFGVQALLGGAVVVIGSRDLSQPILRPFLFGGGGVGGAADGPIGANLLISNPFTLDAPKQLETADAGLLLNGSDFSGSANITIAGGTNREELSINGDGFSQTVPMWGLPCDGGATRTAHGGLTPLTNAKCEALPALPPPPEYSCEDDCPDNVKLSGYNDFTIKVGRATYSALPGVAQRVADTLGGCGATMAFVNVGTRSDEEDATTVFRKFAFIGLNDVCAFNVARGTEDRSYSLERQLAHGDPDDRFAFSDFAGAATVDSAALLTILDVPLTHLNLPGSYEADCEGGSISGVMVPISPTDCGDLPEPLHITTPDSTDVDRCNQYKADHREVDDQVRQLGSGVYDDILNSIPAGPALRYPWYHSLFSQIGNTIPNAVFVGKTVTGEPVVTFIDIEILHAERLLSGHYVFRINILNDPCSFNASGEPVLLFPVNCREGMISSGPGTIFPIPQGPEPVQGGEEESNNQEPQQQQEERTYRQLARRTYTRIPGELDS